MPVVEIQLRERGHGERHPEPRAEREQMLGCSLFEERISECSIRCGEGLAEGIVLIPVPSGVEVVAPKTQIRNHPLALQLARSIDGPAGGQPIPLRDLVARRQEGIEGAVVDAAVREVALDAGLRLEEPIYLARQVALQVVDDQDRKSTRLNSSHVKISYA